jgi:hypothetical protein
MGRVGGTGYDEEGGENITGESKRSRKLGGYSIGLALWGETRETRDSHPLLTTD